MYFLMFWFCADEPHWSKITLTQQRFILNFGACADESHWLKILETVFQNGGTDIHVVSYYTF